MIPIEIPQKLEDVFIGPARYRGAYGGRGSAKSWAFARMALVRAYEKKTRILCVRELQNSIKDSVHRLLVDQIAALQLPGFLYGESFIRHVNGSEFLFKGLRTNAGEIKSTEGVNLCWVEEAQSVSHHSWEILIPTIRDEGSEIWVTLNPELKTDSTSRRFIENQPPKSKIVKLNWRDNPWLTAELRAEKDYLLSIDPEAYLHVWEGEYRDPNKGGAVVKNWSIANVDDIPYDPLRKIFISMDFNVDPMCWALAHRFNGEYHFFDEIVIENTNIVDSIAELARRYRNHTAGFIITGDASGRRRDAGTEDANATYYTIVMNEMSANGMRNFSKDLPSFNSLVEKRIEAFNAFVYNASGYRRIKIDRTKCKQMKFICENLHYIPGTGVIWEPSRSQLDKDPKLKFQRDDMFDAMSYLVNRYDPIRDETKLNKPKYIETAYKGRF